jgi:hypothetical protein
MGQMMNKVRQCFSLWGIVKDTSDSVLLQTTAELQTTITDTVVSLTLQTTITDTVVSLTLQMPRKMTQMIWQCSSLCGNHQVAQTDTLDT